MEEIFIDEGSILIDSKINNWDVDYLPSELDLQIEKERRLFAEAFLVNEIILSK